MKISMRSHRRGNAGLVLPIVLLLLVLITMVVAAQLRRGINDERLSGALRTYAVADSAVQTVLRWCEMQVSLKPLDTITIPAPVRDLAATPPWKTAANWDPANNRALNFSGVALAGTTEQACLVERADDELMMSISDSGFAADPSGKSRWMKFRITARVLRESGGYEYAQSELRLYQD